MKGRDLEFRPMTSGDEQAVRALVSEVFEPSKEGKMGLSSEGRETLRRYAQPESILQRAGMGYFNELAFLNGELAGLIELRGADCISLLYVRPRFASQGVGSHLVARAAARCAQLAPEIKHLKAWVLDDAAPFYEKLGFIRSGRRSENGGVGSTPFRLLLATKGRALSAKLHSRKVELFVFSGTGNTLWVAREVTKSLRAKGVSVSLRSMEGAMSPLPQDAALGLAFPVACFSTYPTVQRFIQALPPGEGREAFLIGTMGGLGLGMQHPIRKELQRKGYRPIGAHLFTMPGNYNNKKMPVERNETRLARAREEIKIFTALLLDSGISFGGGMFSPLSFLLHRLARTRRPWDWFYKAFPIEANVETCVKCGRCAALCPEKAIEMNPYPSIDPTVCQSCQRCLAFCPVGALHVPGKPAEVYRAMSYEDFMKGSSGADL